MGYIFFSAFWLTDALIPVEVWPELERAECLARGAALKWASGVFCRPEHLERLGQYRKRESQRTASIHSRLKVSSDHYFTSIRMPLKSICPSKSARKVICSLAFFKVSCTVLPGRCRLGSRSIAKGTSWAERSVSWLAQGWLGVQEKFWRSNYTGDTSGDFCLSPPAPCCS